MMRTISWKEAVIVPAIVLVVLGIAAWFLIENPAVKFDGDRVVSTNPASCFLRFNTMNTEDAQNLTLREGDTLSVSWLIESGGVDLVIVMEGEEPLYQANGRGNGDAAAFDLTIPKSGEYTITVTGKNARGWLRFAEK